MSCRFRTRLPCSCWLRVASQNANRKLSDIATEVGDTGMLDLPGGQTVAGWRATASSARRGDIRLHRPDEQG